MISLNSQTIIIIFLVILVVLVIIFKKINEKKIDKFSETSCVCCFDLDNTITCGLDNAKTAIKECKKRNCKLAINTARTSPFIGDLQLKSLDLEKKDIENDIYYGDWDKKNITFSDQYFAQEIANTKLNHLTTLKDKYSVPKNRIILFDDVKTNIDTAKENGYSVVFANDPKCGLTDSVKSDIARILDKTE